MTSSVKFSEIAELVMGQSPKGADCNETGDGFPLLNGPTEFTERSPLPVQFTTAGKKFSKTGDILFCVRGSTTGRMNYADQAYAIGRGIGAIRGINGYPTAYIRAVLEHNLDRLLVAATGSTFPNVGKDLLNNFEVNVCSPEQAQQANKLLVGIEDKRYLNSQTNQTLEEMAQAIFKSWFVDFDPVKAKINGDKPEGMDEATASLFPEKLVESELGLIPEGWKVSSLSELIKLTGGGTPKRSEETYWNGDIPWFSVKDVPSGSNVFVVDTDEKITELGLNKSSTKLLPKGTTIITARGTVGKLALVGTDMCMNQSCYGIRGKEVGDYYNYFNLKEAVSTLQRNTHGAVFDTITTKTFDTYSMAFSGAELANKFDVLVAPLLQKIEANVRQNIELATLRDILLPKLLSGEIEL
ncbi:restriction endonuclease subunit S [Vibrio fluvialis]|nr:restriction endonuclease subunit S [Vibrio fluvialis]HBC3946439.1 restriction endonuclease subunit S [Vibrio parahaemolyticus]HCH6297084.1 restriction endonuclease subunit S [Vibrio parahaemolyticus]